MTIETMLRIIDMNSLWTMLVAVDLNWLIIMIITTRQGSLLLDLWRFYCPKLTYFHDDIHLNSPIILNVFLHNVVLVTIDLNPPTHMIV